MASRGCSRVVFGQKTTPLDRIGAYVPGGFALYPSTALMNIVPAKVAGVREVVVCIPPMPDGTVRWQRFSLPTLQVRTLSIRLGGRRRSLQWHMGHRASRRWTRSLDRATCTYGRKAPCAECGGNRLPRGPSEIAVLADGGNPEFIAADILAQLEHGPTSSGFLLTPSPELAREVKKALTAQREAAPRKDLN